VSVELRGARSAAVPALPAPPLLLALLASLLLPLPFLLAPPAATAETLLNREFGVEERVRFEDFANAKDWNSGADDQTEQLRFRTKLWGKLSVPDQSEFMVLLNNESRKIFTPETDFKFDEIIFENLYLDWRFGEGMRMRLGRQNLSRGEGFILIEGTPGDGSRTIYCNALDVIQSFADSSQIEIIALSDPHRDQYLPVIEDRGRSLVEWDEAAAGFYVTARDIPATVLDAYYFLKTEREDTRPPDNPAYQPDRSVQTLGGRADRKLGRGFALTAEFAGQWGSIDPDRAIRAWGGYARLKRTFAHAITPSFSVAVIGLSGDDQATGADENWDPLFSRWPSWSELYIYSLSKEKGTAYWTNEKMLQVEFQAAPWKPLSLRATYYRMGAFHAYPGDPAVFADGRHRGDLVEFRADLRAGRSWKGHILYEWMAPGDYYASDDAAHFFRVEVIYTLKRAW